MIIQTRMVLVLFHKDIQTSAIEKLLKDFGPSLIGWAQMFEENKALYAVQVPVHQVAEWKDALAQLPEVAWTQCADSIKVVPCHAA